MNYQLYSNVVLDGVVRSSYHLFLSVRFLSLPPSLSYPLTFSFLYITLFLFYSDCFVITQAHILNSILLHRAKQFREALSKKHEMDCGLAMIIKQRAKVSKKKLSFTSLWYNRDIALKNFKEDSYLLEGDSSYCLFLATI